MRRHGRHHATTRPRTVGILGAGQLGCMLASSLQGLGARVRFFDPDPSAPGHAMTDAFTCAPWTDATELEAFFRACDVVSYEFENVDVRHLASTSERTGVPLLPGASVLAITQSRASEKAFLSRSGLPCAPFRVIDDAADLDDLTARAQFPFIAKTLRGGYDGKGQRFVRGPAGLEGLSELLPFVVEDALPLALEASVIVGRDRSGAIACYPPFENAHADQVLDTTLFPAPSLPASTAEVLESLARECAEHLGVVGLLTTEFFLTRGPAARTGSPGWQGGLRRSGDYWIGVNEFAPRPHNSGHVTRQASFASQFDLHARILLGLPLPAPAALEPLSPGVFAMGNLLGDVWEAQGATHGAELSLDVWSAFPDVLDVTLYGKETPRPGRKMGHFCLRAPDADSARVRVKAFRGALAESGGGTLKSSP